AGSRRDRAAWRRPRQENSSSAAGGAVPPSRCAAAAASRSESGNLWKRRARLRVEVPLHQIAPERLDLLALLDDLDALGDHAHAHLFAEHRHRTDEALTDLR